MNLEEEYKIVRLTDENMSDLIPLYKDAFGQDKTVEQIRDKFNTSFFGLTHMGFMAVDSKGVVAAFYPLFIMKYKLNGKELLTGQVGDLMTHSQHRRRGLLGYLAAHTNAAAYTEGLDVIMSVTQVESSFLGLLKAGFKHIHTLNGYFVKVNTLPLAYLFSKSSITIKMYHLYANFIVSLFEDKSEQFVHHASVLHGEGARSADFLRYKKRYGKSMIIKLKKRLYWIKISGNILQVGDIERIENEDLEKTLKPLKKLAFLLGMRAVQFNTSPGSYWDNLFVRHYSPIESFYIILLTPGFNNDDFKFNLADTDGF